MKTIKFILAFLTIFFSSITFSFSQSYGVNWSGDESPCPGSIKSYDISGEYVDEYGNSQGVFIESTENWNVVGGTITAGGYNGDIWVTVQWDDTLTAEISVKVTLQKVSASHTNNVINDTLDVKVNSLYNYTPTGNDVVINYGDDTEQTISIDPIKYPDDSETSIYKWIIPIGWIHSGSTSDGTTPFTTNSSSITVTPDRGCSGNATISVYGKNSKCPGKEDTEIKTITVSRVWPTIIISGPNVICGTGNYSISLPLNINVYWEATSHLTLVSGQGTSTATFSKDDSGSSQISARLTVDGCSGISNIITKDVCVGTPTPTISSTWSEACNCYVSDPLETFTTYDWDMITCNPSTSSTDYVWEVWGYELPMFAQQSETTNVMETTFPYTAYGKHLSYTFYDAQYYTIKAKQRLCSSWSSWATKYVTVGESLIMIISPNPTNGETTISFKSNSKRTTFDENVEWELEIFAQTQLLKEKKTKLTGNSTTIQTAGWKDGIYTARVKFRIKDKPDKIITGKLIVKR